MKKVEKYSNQDLFLTFKRTAKGCIFRNLLNEKWKSKIIGQK